MKSNLYDIPTGVPLSRAAWVIQFYRVAPPSGPHVREIIAAPKPASAIFSQLTTKTDDRTWPRSLANFSPTPPGAASTRMNARAFANSR